MEIRLPPSPPAEDGIGYEYAVMETAARVLHTQGEAIKALSQQFADTNSYDCGPASLFCHSLGLLKRIVQCGGKVVFSGMGKSHKIGSKLVATLHSFGISAAALHPSDALHGDVGLVQKKDIVVVISASGSSSELTAMMRHLPEGLPTICLTCNENSPLAKACTGVIAAPVSAHHKEQSIYGLAAPTITTTMCLVIGDAMCVALYESIERDEKRRRANFKRWHPGGAIGVANGLGESVTDQDVVTPWQSIPQLGDQTLYQCSELQLWKSVALSPYVCCGGHLFRSADIIQTLESGTDLNSVRGYPLSLAPNSRGRGLCVFRNALNEPTGVLWD